MSSFSEIQTRVLRRVIDLPAAVQAEVPDLINDAMKSLQNAHDFSAMKTTLSAVVTVTGQRSLVQRPANWKKWQPAQRPYRISNSGGTQFLIPQTEASSVPTEFNTTTDIGSPKYLAESDPNDAGVRNIDVYPLPDGASDWPDLEYRIYIPYYRFVAPLSSGNPTNWFTEHAYMYLIDMATSMAFALDWDLGQETAWLQKAMGWKQEAVLLDKRERLAGIEALVPQTGRNGPLTRR